MVELELFQGRKRAVSLFHQFQPPALELARLVKTIARGLRLTEERPRDEEDGQQSKPGTEGESESHAGAAA